jgi:hypothetical protein
LIVNAHTAGTGSEEHMEQKPGMASTGAGSGEVQPPVPQVAYILKPRPKWQALRAIAAIFKALAWITAGFGVIAVCFALVAGSRAGDFGFLPGLLYALATLIGVGAVFLLLYSRAEQILLFIAIEENTRRL